MRWCLDPGETPLYGRERGCDEFEQDVLRFDGPSEARASEGDDEVLYVLAGRGVAEVGGERAELAPGTAVYVRHGPPGQVTEAAGLEILSVVVREPLPSDSTHAIVGVGEAGGGAGPAGRHSRLLAPCSSATQFVAYIPVGPAPGHFHKYDEVVYV